MTHEQIKSIIDGLHIDGVWFPWWSYILAFISFFFAAYFGAYAKRKGENIATKEDIENIKDQLESTTRLTESIKAEMAKSIWIDQKGWEFKRDLYCSLIESIQDLKYPLAKLAEYHQDKQVFVAGLESQRLKIVNENLEACNLAIHKMRKHNSISELILTKNAHNLIETLINNWNNTGINKSKYTYNEILEHTEKTSTEIIKIAREDILPVKTLTKKSSQN